MLGYRSRLGHSLRATKRHPRERSDFHNACLCRPTAEVQHHSTALCWTHPSRAPCRTSPLQMQRNGCPMHRCASRQRALRQPSSARRLWHHSQRHQYHLCLQHGVLDWHQPHLRLLSLPRGVHHLQPLGQLVLARLPRPHLHLLSLRHGQVFLHVHHQLGMHQDAETLDLQRRFGATTSSMRRLLGTPTSPSRLQTGVDVHAYLATPMSPKELSAALRCTDDVAIVHV